MDGVKVKQAEPDISITLATSILVLLCFCPILGVISVAFSCMICSNEYICLIYQYFNFTHNTCATVMAMLGQRDGETASSRKMKNFANWTNLAGFLVGVLFLGAVLVVAFAHKGSDIYFPAPGERNKIFWESKA